MARWQRELGDEAPLTVENPAPKTKDLTGRRWKVDHWQPAWIREKYFGAK